MSQGVLHYAREFKKREGKPAGQIEEEVERIAPMDTLEALQGLIAGVRESVGQITVPTFVVQGRHDQVIDPESANIIYNGINSSKKELQWYEESGHVITLDKEKEQLHEDVYNFLQQLDWKE